MIKAGHRNTTTDRMPAGEPGGGTDARETNETSAPGRVRVAVDGPAGAGKSTVAKRVAAAIGADYIDTGAMYRAVALKLLNEGIEPETEPDRLAEMLGRTDIDFTEGKTMLDGADVTGLIRSREVTAMASRCSALAPVREKLVGLQRKMGLVKSVVMDGRDIGTNVFPDAEHKFYLTASAEERARRRCADVAATGRSADYQEVLEAIEARDHDDTHRALNPLKQAADAALIDTDGIGIEEVIEKILSIIRDNHPAGNR